MRVVIQRVKSASVSVDGEVISQIKNGFCILVGISRDDTKSDSDYLVDKILKLKLFHEDKKNGKEQKVKKDRRWEKRKGEGWSNDQSGWSSGTFPTIDLNFDIDDELDEENEKNKHGGHKHGKKTWTW